ncbi:MAG TPA: hypothetical protein VLG76_08500 [Rhabdochlamydiaceae bacterium]|nr:hypothetical protein [Rhabdochlamydiaceae bacterium]
MKQNELLEKIPPLLPMDFFSLSCDLEFVKESSRPLKKQHRLQGTSELLAEEAFATCYLGWNEEGIFFEAHVDVPFENCYFPNFREGDSLELFIDTRDLKTAGFLTRFCHHFVFLPKAIEEIKSQEITHFRTEDSHPLADAHLLKNDAEFHAKKYELKIFIPSDCLCGYDPNAFDRMGFTYRINRVGNQPQHFSVSSHNFSIEKHPSLWASFKLSK